MRAAEQKSDRVLSEEDPYYIKSARTGMQLAGHIPDKGESVQLFKSILVPADDGGIGDAFAMVEAELQKIPGCSRSEELKFHMLVDEIFTNIENYAYDEAPGEIFVSFSYDDADSKARLVFRDEGKEYDPTKEKLPDLSLPLRERHTGGMGILMVRNTVDDLIYERRDGYNILTLIKTIGGQNV